MKEYVRRWLAFRRARAQYAAEFDRGGYGISPPQWAALEDRARRWAGMA